MRRDFGTPAPANLAFGLRVQFQADAARRRRALPRVVVGCRAYAAEREHDVVAGERAGQRHALLLPA